MFQGNPEPPFEQKIWEKKLRNGVAARVCTICLGALMGSPLCQMVDECHLATDKVG